MIKLKDILNEVQLSKYQLFATGTGGRGGANGDENGPTNKGRDGVVVVKYRS